MVEASLANLICSSLSLRMNPICSAIYQCGLENKIDLEVGDTIVGLVLQRLEGGDKEDLDEPAKNLARAFSDKKIEDMIKY